GRRRFVLQQHHLQRLAGDAADGDVAERLGREPDAQQPPERTRHARRKAELPRQRPQQLRDAVDEDDDGERDAEAGRHPCERVEIEARDRRREERDADHERHPAQKPSHVNSAAASRRSATVSTSHHAEPSVSTPRIRPRAARRRTPPLSEVSPAATASSSAAKMDEAKTKTPVSSASNGSSCLPIAVIRSPSSLTRVASSARTAVAGPRSTASSDSPGADG